MDIDPCVLNNPFWHGVSLTGFISGSMKNEVGRPDTFPTLYKANSVSRLRRYCLSAGLFVEDLRHIEGRPEYLRFSVPSYLTGALYERVVNSTRILSSFRAVLIAVMSKPGDP